MGYTNFPFGVTSFGVPLPSSGVPGIFSVPAGVSAAPFPRRYLFVDPTNGLDGNNGFATTSAKRTLAAALTARLPGDCIVLVDVAVENVVINRYYTGISNASGGPLWIVGLSTQGAVAVAPASGIAILNHEDDVTLVNLDVAGVDASAAALQSDGSRGRFVRCKLEGGATSGACAILGPGTVAQRAAHTRGNSGDNVFDDCEFGWGFDGIRFLGTDYGAATEVYVRRCLFHDLSNSSFEEAVGSGGSAAVLYAGLWVKDCLFTPNEDGSIPTKYFSLDDNNANSGIVTGCSFPVAINSGKNLVSTKLIWVGNYHTGGISTAQPS